MTSATTLLKDDHRTVEQLFRRFEKAGPKAYKSKRQVVDRIIEELSIHAAIEEQVFYPTVRARVPGAEDVTLESLEEHHIVKWVLSELEGMAPEDERFTAKVTVLMENVRHHVEEEEQELFPKVEKALSKADLEHLGERLDHAKAGAPTRPHPRTPDTPPGNVLLAPAVALADRATGAVRGLAQSTLDRVTGGDDLAEVPGKAVSAVTEAPGKAIAAVTEAPGRAISAITDGAEDAADRVREVADEAGRQAVGGARRTRARASSAAADAAEAAEGAAQRVERGARKDARRSRAKAGTATSSSRSKASTSSARSGSTRSGSGRSASARTSSTTSSRSSSGTTAKRAASSRSSGRTTSKRAASSRSSSRTTTKRAASTRPSSRTTSKRAASSGAGSSRSSSSRAAGGRSGSARSTSSRSSRSGSSRSR